MDQKMVACKDGIRKDEWTESKEFDRCDHFETSDSIFVSDILEKFLIETKKSMKCYSSLSPYFDPVASVYPTFEVAEIKTIGSKRKSFEEAIAQRNKKSKGKQRKDISKKVYLIKDTTVSWMSSSRLETLLQSMASISLEKKGTPPLEPIVLTENYLDSCLSALHPRL